MFYDDETGNSGQVDFGKLQQFLTTVVLAVAYATEIVMLLLHPVPVRETTEGSPCFTFRRSIRGSSR